MMIFHTDVLNKISQSIGYKAAFVTINIATANRLLSWYYKHLHTADSNGTFIQSRYHDECIRKGSEYRINCLAK